MKNSKKRSFSIVVSVILLVLACALVFSACAKEAVTPTPDPDTNQNDPNTNTGNETNEPGNGNEDDNGSGNETETPVLNVSFDENATYQLDSFEDALDVTIVSGGSERTANFTVQSANITADGKYIQVVITAEGLRKSVLLPYASETPAIREDLLPLYNLLIKEGDRSFALTLSGEIFADGESEAEALAIKAIVNVNGDDIQFALTDANAENEKAFVIFQDGVFNIFGQTLSVEELEGLIEYLAPVMGESDFEDDDLEEVEDKEDAYEFEEEEEFQPTKENVETFFVALSAVLDACDKTFNNPFLPKQMRFMSIENGVYRLTIGLDKLPYLLALLPVSTEESDFDLTEIVNRIEDLLGDASKNIELGITLTVKESGASVALQLQDRVTGGGLSVAVALDIAEEGFELPEESYSLPELPELPELSELLALYEFLASSELPTLPELLESPELSALWELLGLPELPELSEFPELPELQDIEIAIPIQLPQNEFEAELKAIIRLSNFAADAECKDYVTATMTINGQEDALRFVLNDGYVYLDITELFAMLAGNPASSDFGTFYQAFEIDGEPASLFEILSMSIFNTDQPDVTVEDEPDSWDDDDDDNPAWDEPTTGEEHSGVGAGYSAAQDLVFRVNTIDEQALRELLIITVSFEEDEEDLIVTDYQIEGFDPSTPSSGEITILIPEYGVEMYISIVIYSEAELYDIQADAMSIPVGTTVAEAKGEYVWVEAIMQDTTDEDIQWSVFPDDFTIQSINFEGVDETTAFDQTGDCTLVVEYSGKQTFCVVTVYDPDNLQLVDVECESLVYLEKNATEEELREQLYVTAVYDDGSREPIEDYEIEGFDPESDSIVTVTWGDYTRKATVSIWDYGDDEPDDDAVGFSPEDLLQFLRLDTFMEDGKFDFSKLAALYEENEELINSVITIDENGVLTIAVNTPDDQDLLAVLNLFAGISTEEGLQDIDESLLIARLNNPIFATMFEKMIGVSFEDFLADLTLSASTSLEEGFAGKIELTDHDGLSYLTVGIKINLAVASAPFELTEEEIAKAQDFSILSMLFLGIF